MITTVLHSRPQLLFASESGDAGFLLTKEVAGTREAICCGHRYCVSNLGLPKKHWFGEEAF